MDMVKQKKQADELIELCKAAFPVNGAGKTAEELCRAVGVSKYKIFRLLDEMEKQGLEIVVTRKKVRRRDGVEVPKPAYSIKGKS